MVAQSEWTGGMGRNWADLYEATDRQLAEVGEAVLARLDAQPGERVLDLGCGAGTTTLAVARAVGPTGRVTGVDVSPDLAARARDRAASLPQATILEADAAAHAFDPQSHDALVSRHGCMFFDDPAAAFANVRRALRPGARVVMSAFAPLAENPWATVPLEAVERTLGPAPASPPGPGPYAWADPATFRTALAAAGFDDVAGEGRTVTFTLGIGDDPDPVARAVRMTHYIGMVARRLREADEADRERVRPALAAAFAPHVRDGWVRLPARIWLVTARNPA